MPNDESTKSALFKRNPYTYDARCALPSTICENIKSLGWANAFDVIAANQTMDGERIYEISLQEEYLSWRADIKIVGRVKARESFIEGFNQGIHDLRTLSEENLCD